jgi:hypothetical protein
MTRRGLCFRPSKQISEVRIIGKRRTCRHKDNPSNNDATRKPNAKTDRQAAPIGRAND